MTTAVASPLKGEEVNIRLRRMNSATSSTYSRTPTLPPYTSTTSFGSTNPFLSPSDDDASTFSRPLTGKRFIPTSTFKIEAEGKKPISFPVPPKQLEIPILGGSSGDGVRYLSVRPMRKSGSCALVRADDEAQTPISSTTYHFGPNRPPRVWIAHPNGEEEEFVVECKKLLGRACWFDSPKWGKFEWRYAVKAERRAFSNPPPNNLLLLEKITTSAEGKEERTTVARLVRGDETRTRGTSASAAGNGGLLEMCLRNGEGATGLDGLEGLGKSGVSVEDGEEVIDEVTVLVTCLIMLKKEIDRLRAIQIAIITAGAGS